MKQWVTVGSKSPFSSQAPSETVITVPWRRFNDYPVAGSRVVVIYPKQKAPEPLQAYCLLRKVKI